MGMFGQVEMGNGSKECQPKIIHLDSGLDMGGSDTVTLWFNSRRKQWNLRVITFFGWVSNGLTQALLGKWLNVKSQLLIYF